MVLTGKKMESLLDRDHVQCEVKTVHLPGVNFTVQLT